MPLGKLCSQGFCGCREDPGANLGGSGPGDLLGGSRIIKFSNCLQGNRANGPEPSWSSTKSPKEHVKWFRKVYFHSAKLPIGRDSWEASWAQICKEYVFRSSCLQWASSSSHTCQVPSAGEQVTQSLTSSSLKHWSRSVRRDKIELREVTWLRMHWRDSV